jgi:hypothetical protein
MKLRGKYGVIFGIVSNYFVVYEYYFVVGEFSWTIRAASVYFLFIPYFPVMLSISMSGYFGTGPMDIGEGSWLLWSIFCKYNDSR